MQTPKPREWAKGQVWIFHYLGWASRGFEKVEKALRKLEIIIAFPSIFQYLSIPETTPGYALTHTVLLSLKKPYWVLSVCVMQCQVIYPPARSEETEPFVRW